MPTPRHVPTDELRGIVAALKAAGGSHEGIARSININRSTLEKYYQKELTNSGEVANLRVAGTAYRLAVSGDCPAATFFWLKTRAKWRETTRHEHSYEHLSDDELRRQVEATLRGVAASADEPEDGPE